MKLWQVIQWGNPKEGPDGKDTQCLVSAKDLESAIAIGEFHIRLQNGETYRNGRAHCVILLGHDDMPDGEAVLLTIPWLNAGFNLGRKPAWHRSYDGGEWEKQVID